MKKERNIALAVCAVLAALILLLTSQSSPLYPINLWGDANCLFTVGRVMKDGGVLYRDIYEQKGPLLYLIHALAACLSDTSFWGVYIMEALAMTVALYAAYRLMRLRAGMGFSLGAAAFFGAAFASCTAFIRGDSAEEFCLPLLMAALAIAYAEYGRRAKPMRTKRLLVCGALAGCVATIKYTLLGAMIGLCAVEGVLALKEGGLLRALKSAGVFLGGMAVPILPWIVYFAANGALSDAYAAYIYNNIFLYSGAAKTWANRLTEWTTLFADNLLWTVPALLGMIALAFDGGRSALRLGDGDRAVRGDLFRGHGLAVQPAGHGGLRRDRFDAAASALGKAGDVSPREKGADGGGLRGQPCLGVFCYAERVSARRGYRQSGAGHVRRIR